jgi:hypothetical protein
VGCEALRRLAFDMEKAGKRKDNAVLIDLMPQLARRFGEVRGLMAREV